MIDFRSGVFAGHDGANAGFAFGDGGEGNAGGHDSGVEEGPGEVHGAAAVADDDGGDGGFAFWSGVAADVEAGVGELLFEVVGVVPEALDAVGFISRISKAAMQVAATEGGCEVEKRKGRAR